MMPVAPKPAPTDPALRTCIDVYRNQARTEPVRIVWKRFRDSACGKSWFVELQSAYGHRCLYCDHSPTRSIDHRDAKSAGVADAFEWKNFRPSCGDCNRLKGTLATVDPVTADPFAFLEFDVTTGKPAARSTATRARRTKAETTLRLLNHPTFNDARRAKRKRVVDVLRRFTENEKGFDAARVLEELAANEPHRAIVRDLVLDAEADLHQWSALVRLAMKKLPTLKAWAVKPTT
ncbi:MAG: hypothetical protein ABJE95_32980 [Byssovorax sp.]